MNYGTVVRSMDKTLADYITRTMARLEAEKQKVEKPVNNENQYLVYPEQPKDSDHKVNPFSQV